MKLWVDMPGGDDRRYYIYLNGEKITNAIEADDEAGKVWIHIPEANPARGEVDYKVLYGKVEFRPITTQQVYDDRGDKMFMLDNTIRRILDVWQENGFIQGK